MNSVLEVEMGSHRRQIIGVVIHVVTVTDLTRPAMAAPVMGDDPIAVVKEEQHLRIPVVRRQRPTVAEHDRLALAPVLVENLNAVLRFDKAHVSLLV